MLLAASPGDAGEFGFAFRLGSPRSDSGGAIATDTAGNVYVAGLSDGTIDFDPGTGTRSLSGDAFIAKYTPTGALAWARVLQGDFQYQGVDMCADRDGNVYLTGGFLGNVDFNPGAAASNLNSGPNPAGFILKLDTGGGFAWAKAFRGGETNGTGIAVDGSGNVYTTGFFSGTVDFDPGSESANLTALGAYDGYVSKVDGNGDFLWARRVGGAYPTQDFYDEGDRGYDIAVDGDGNVYTTGTFRGHVDFDPGPNESMLVSAGTFGEPHVHYNDGFIWKLDTDGNFGWAKAMGSRADGRSIALDSEGNVYAAGCFYGPSQDEKSIRVYKLGPAGESLWTATAADGPFKPYTNPQASLGLDATGSVYVAGQFRGATNFGNVEGAFPLVSRGGTDIFVARLDQRTGGLKWADAMGGTGNDLVLALAVGSAGNVYTTGSFESRADFDPTDAAHNLASAGEEDGFVSNLTYYGVGQLTLSTGSSLPFGQLVVTSDMPLDPSSPITARFTDGNAYTVDVPILSSTATTATLIVPFYVDPTTGETKAGAVQVQLVQGGRVVATAVAPLEILDLEQLKHSPGTIVLGYLNAAAEELRAQLDTLPGTILDTNENVAGLAALAGQLQWLAAQVETVADTPSQSVSLGTIDSREVVLDTAALTQMDRMLLTFYAGEAALGGLSTQAGLKAQADPLEGVYERYLMGYLLYRIVARDQLDHMEEVEAERAYQRAARLAELKAQTKRDYEEASRYEATVGDVLVGISQAAVNAANRVAGSLSGLMSISGLQALSTGTLLNVQAHGPEMTSDFLSATRRAMDAAAKTIKRVSGKAAGRIGQFAEGVSNSIAGVKGIPNVGPGYGIRVVPRYLPSKTYEDQTLGPAEFDVRLTLKPSGPVVLTVGVDDPSEGDVLAEGYVTADRKIYFNQDFFGPVLVKVKGVDDNLADKDKSYNLQVMVAESSDPHYSVGTTAALGLVNVDDEKPLTISIKDPPAVAEGREGQRTTVHVPVELSALSDKPVTFKYRTEPTMQARAKAGTDYRAVPNWKTATIAPGLKTFSIDVTVFGNDVDDPVDARFFVVAIAPVSNIPVSNRLADVEIDDDDGAWVVVEPMDQETEWPGNNGSFRVKLASQPTAPVKIRLRSDSTEQGIPDKSTLVFTPDKFGKGGWNRWQIVTVKAQPGGAAAGNIAYTIVTDQAVSKDKKYAVLDPDDVPMVNHVAGPGVTLEVTDPTTSSSGGTGTFRAHLNSRPALNTTVTIVLTDDNPEGKVVLPTTKEFVFNSTNWWKWQMATVKGQQSGNEGLHPFTIVTSNTISNDPKYKDLDVLDADMVNEVVVRPGPWTVWVADTGGYDVVDSRRSHLIDTAHNKKIGKYADDQFVTLFSENSITKIAEEAYWKYRANSRWYYEYGFMVNLSGNVLRNGVAVYLSDHPWQQSADAAIASMGWRRPLSDEKDEPGGLLRPLAVDAALSAAL